LIEETKYQFGTVDSGSRIHLLYDIPSWGQGPMCDTYHRDLHPDTRLTIHDVNCLQCIRTLTHHRLLSETWDVRAQQSEEFAKFAATHLGKFLRRAGSRQRDLAKEDGHSDSQRYAPPHLLFESEKEVRCAFFSLVIKTGALRRKYEGGVRAFVERYHARCNRDLVFLCAMSSDDLSEPILDLESSGLNGKDDFACFDAASQAIGLEMGRKMGSEEGPEVKFPIPWLKGYVQKGGVMVYLTGPE
jgi:hypothetical protein